jgi:ABC-type multidrug transport system ATPase subunit
LSDFAVEAMNVSKRYGHIYALRNFSARIETGRLAAILGPNGSGKTTLLKILATHIQASSGDVKIFGLDPRREASEIKAKVGYTGHRSFLYDELTVIENLSFYSSIFPTKNSRRYDYIHELADLLGFVDWLEIPVGNLSHGLRKRVDIARAIIHDPNLLLLDEPFSGLDEKSRMILVDYMSGKGESTIVLSSHQADLAERLCDHLIFLEQGKMVEETIS